MAIQKAPPKAPPGYKLLARAWGKIAKDHDVRVLRRHGYSVKVVKRKVAPDPRRPESKLDLYYVFAKRRDR